VLFDVTNFTTLITDDPNSIDLAKELDPQLLPNELGLKRVPILFRTKNAKLPQSHMVLSSLVPLCCSFC